MQKNFQNAFKGTHYILGTCKIRYLMRIVYSYNWEALSSFIFEDTILIRNTTFYILLCSRYAQLLWKMLTNSVTPVDHQQIVSLHLASPLVE